MSTVFRSVGQRICGDERRDFDTDFDTDFDFDEDGMEPYRRRGRGLYPWCLKRS